MPNKEIKITGQVNKVVMLVQHKQTGVHSKCIVETASRQMYLMSYDAERTEIDSCSLTELYDILEFEIVAFDLFE